MLTATILDLPDEVCRVELDHGLVAFVKGQFIEYKEPLWFEVEPKLATQAGKWRRAISPFNRQFLFWVAYADKPGTGVKPDHIRLWPFH